MGQKLTRSLPAVALLVATWIAARGPAAGAQSRLDGWPVSPPRMQGVDSAAWLALDAEVRAGKLGYVDGITVIRNGVMVFDRDYRNDYARIYKDSVKDRGPFDYYAPEWHPYYKGTALHTLQSVTKSVTSALVGIAVQRAEIMGVDRPALELLLRWGDTVANLDDRKRSMTLKHVLTMTAGLDWDETSVPYEDPRNIGTRMELSPDWVNFTISRPMSEQPGTRFNYSSGVSQLLSRVLYSATGKNAEVYAQEFLFGPLGIKEYFWKRAPGGLNDTEGGLYLSRHDLARVGQLYLNGGTWEGRRIVPEAWIRESVTPAVRVRGKVRYGYQWWLLSADTTAAEKPIAWYGSGYGGQTLLVLPAEGMVVVATSWNIAGNRGIGVTRLRDVARASVGAR